jgi:hypothetical protein
MAKIVTLLDLRDNLTVLSLCTTLKGKINEEYTLGKIRELLPEFLRSSISGAL